jgi:osmotically-inducible protein OsmY
MLPVHAVTSSHFILLIALLQLGSERDKPVDSPPTRSAAAQRIPPRLNDPSGNHAVLTPLRQDPGVDPSRIVRRGNVRLMGGVASAAERQGAFTEACIVGTIYADNSGLDVTWWIQKHDVHRKKLLRKSDSEIGCVLPAERNDRRVRGGALSVNVAQAVATLSGAVPSLGAKLAVGELARNVLPVKNELDVRPAPCRAGSQAAALQTSHTDAEIAAAIRQQLRRNPFLDDSTIAVSVTGGRAVLTGNVATAAERDLATQDALRGGALEVDNRLSVVAGSAAL